MRSITNAIATTIQLAPPRREHGCIKKKNRGRRRPLHGVVPLVEVQTAGLHDGFQYLGRDRVLALRPMCKALQAALDHLELRYIRKIQIDSVFKVHSLDLV